MKTPWIDISVFVPEVDEAVKLYCDDWQLFRLENQLGEGKEKFALLRYVDSESPLRLTVVQNPDQRDANGEVIPATRNLKLSLPKVNFWEWVENQSNPPAVNSTPWSCTVHFYDPWGNLLSIYTFEVPPPGSSFLEDIK